MISEIVIPGDFLLATPALRGSYFQDSVIFMVECSSKTGSWGLVINHSVHMPLDEVFKRSAKAPNAPRHLHTFFFGGPVQNTDPFQKLSVCILEAGTSVFNGSYEISNGVFISKIPLDMELPISKLIEPLNSTARMFFGYCGWAAGQLENEILNGAWEVSNPVPLEVFSKSRDEVPTTANIFRKSYERHRA
ncbi:MAG: YqgE/AlgH family protein [Fibromonadaceae bacterium]|jgi:putative transcriptional regulator|nr:YqgE/AlgH family protein [Fibromonadaceae bacterium]